MTFQDIVPPSPRRSIRDIPVPENRRPRPTAPAPRKPSPRSEIEAPPPHPPRPMQTEWNEPEERRGGRLWLWLGVIAILAIIFFGLSFFFAKATVKVTPKVQEMTVNQTFSADQKTASLSAGSLSYALITLEKEGG